MVSGSFEERRSVTGVRGLVISLNWTVSLKSLRLKISGEGWIVEGDVLSILDTGIPGRRAWSGEVGGVSEV